MGAQSKFDTVTHFNAESDVFDIRDVFSSLWRRKELFLATLVLITSFVILVTLRMTPIYSSTASVMIDLKKNNASDLQAVLSGSPPDSALVDTEVEILKSLSLSEKVVTQLDLVSDPEFNTNLRDAERFGNFKSWIKSFLPNSLSQENISDLNKDLERERVVINLLSQMSVYRKGTTYVINVTVNSESATKAATIANTFGEVYLLEQLDAKFEATSRTNGWLTDRIDSLKAEVRSAENAVEAYRGLSGLLSAKGSSLVEQQISDLNSQLIIQTADYNESMARLSSVKSQVDRGDAADTITEVLSSSVVRDLRRQEAEVAGKRAELSSRYGFRHPEVIEVEREAADIQLQINQEIKRIVSSLESEVGIARQKVASIETGLSKLRIELSTNNRSLVRLRELERDAEASRSLYENFLEKFKQNDDQESITEADARIISKAIPQSKATAPNVPFNGLMGLILGAALGVGMVVLAEILDGGVSTGADVERDVGLPFIAAIPKIEIGILNHLKAFPKKVRVPDDYITKNPLSVYAESIRTLRSSILLSQATPSRPKVIAITSALPGEGKTTLARSLGQMSSMSGSKTIIIDCDLRLAQMSKDIAVVPKLGLVGYLKKNNSLKDVIITDTESGCDFILNNENEYSHRDLFGAPRFNKLLEMLRKRYDLIILDTSPVLLVAETRTIANLADALVLAARWRRTRADATKTAKNILQDVRAKILGVVLTQVNLKARRKYGSGDYSYYTRQYGEYYSAPREEAFE